MRSLTFPILLFALTGALRAEAQAFTADKRLMVPEGVLRGSPRLLGIAGAFVGVAEGAEGITRNPAAAASKSPYFEHDLNVDFGAAMHFLPPWAVRDQDWDNDGRVDQQETTGVGGLDFLGTQVLYLAGSVAYKGVGLGVGVDLQNFVTRTNPAEGVGRQYFALNYAHAFGSLAVSLSDDQVLLGLGVESTHTFIGVGSSKPDQWLPSPEDVLSYHGWGIQFGGLWRPKDENYRIGFAFRPQTIGFPTTSRREIAGLTSFAQVVAPARVSMGASWALGSTGRNYNITSREGWAELPEPLPDGTPAYSPALTRWLFTTQLDIFLPVSNATYAAAFLEQGAGTPALAAGDQMAFLPRLAVEKEVIEDRLRLRAGGYLEPPLVETAPAVRPHATFGGEVYLFKLFKQRVGFGISVDLARRYQNLSVAFLAWK